jgi:protease I
MPEKKLQGLRVAAIAADGVEQVELTSPMKTLLRNGAEVEVISLRPGNLRSFNFLSPGKKIPVDRTIFTANPRNYDALLLPGGAINPDFLRQSERVLNFVRAFDKARKPIAVICHGPWVLVSAGLVKGRRLTSWPGIKDDVKNAGGNWVDDMVVRDENWISSKGPQDLLFFNRAMVNLFAEYGATAQAHRGDGNFLPALGWIAAGTAIAATLYGSDWFKSRKGQQRKEEFEPAATI